MNLSTDSFVCIDCGIAKSRSDFWSSKTTKSGLHSYCKHCMNARNKVWIMENPERHRQLKREQKANQRKRNPTKMRASQRGAMLRIRFGMTEEQYRAMVAEQGNKCALCAATSPGRSMSGHWNVDHCHRTGAVRGLLCHTCNLRLGVYEVLRNTVGFDAVEQYLTKARTYGSSNNGYTGSVPARPKHSARERAAGDEPVIE